MRRAQDLNSPEVNILTSPPHRLNSKDFPKIITGALTQKPHPSFSQKIAEPETEISSFIKGSIAEIQDLKRNYSHISDNRKKYKDILEWLKNTLEAFQGSFVPPFLNKAKVNEDIQQIFSSAMSQMTKELKTQSLEKACLLKVSWQSISVFYKSLFKEFERELSQQKQKIIAQYKKERDEYDKHIVDYRIMLEKTGADLSKKQKYFYEVVRDNRILRRRISKLMDRLRYELQSNSYLKEENIMFYKENQKLKMVFEAEMDDDKYKSFLGKMEVIERDFRQGRKKITKVNIIKDSKTIDVKQRLGIEKEINEILKRVDVNDLLDLDIVSTPNPDELNRLYHSFGVQSEPLMESIGTNTSCHLFKKSVLVQFNANRFRNITTYRHLEMTIEPCITEQDAILRNYKKKNKDLSQRRTSGVGIHKGEESSQRKSKAAILLQSSFSLHRAKGQLVEPTDTKENIKTSNIELLKNPSDGLKERNSLNSAQGLPQIPERQRSIREKKVSTLSSFTNSSVRKSEDTMSGLKSNVVPRKSVLNHRAPPFGLDTQTETNKVPEKVTDISISERSSKSESSQESESQPSQESSKHGGTSATQNSHPHTNKTKIKKRNKKKQKILAKQDPNYDEEDVSLLGEAEFLKTEGQKTEGSKTEGQKRLSKVTNNQGKISYSGHRKNLNTLPNVHETSVIRADSFSAEILSPRSNKVSNKELLITKTEQSRGNQPIDSSTLDFSSQGQQSENSQNMPSIQKKSEYIKGTKENLDYRLNKQNNEDQVNKQKKEKRFVHNINQLVVPSTRDHREKTDNSYAYIPNLQDSYTKCLTEQIQSLHQPKSKVRRREDTDSTLSFNFKSSILAPKRPEPLSTKSPEHLPETFLSKAFKKINLQILVHKNNLLKQEISFQEFIQLNISHNYGLKILAGDMVDRLKISLFRYVGTDPSMLVFRKLLMGLVSDPFCVEFKRYIFRIYLLTLEFWVGYSGRQEFSALKIDFTKDLLAGFFHPSKVEGAIDFRSLQKTESHYELFSKIQNVLEEECQDMTFLNAIYNLQSVLSSKHQMTSDEFKELLGVLEPNKVSVYNKTKEIFLQLDRGSQSIPLFKLILQLKKLGYQDFLQIEESIQKIFNSRFGDAKRDFRAQLKEMEAVIPRSRYLKVLKQMSGPTMHQSQVLLYQLVSIQYSNQLVHNSTREILGGDLSAVDVCLCESLCNKSSNTRSNIPCVS